MGSSPRASGLLVLGAVPTESYVRIIIGLVRMTLTDVFTTTANALTLVLGVVPTPECNDIPHIAVSHILHQYHVLSLTL